MSRRESSPREDPPPPDPRSVRLPFPAQPMPVRVRYICTAHAAGATTAIGRTWAPGDAARCRLCPPRECSADGDGVCLVLVGARVEPRDAALFSVADWRSAASEGLAGRRVDPDGGAGRG